MIELKNVSKFYSDNNVVTIGLKNVNLKLNKGEFVAITGDSGSGKSTLLNVISSIDTYDEGEILFYDSETFYFNQNDSDIFRKNNVSFIFQKYNIVDSYSVLQNVMLPLLIKGMSEEEAKAEAFEIIKRVGLEHRAYNRGSKLSGGEKQRCVIARALASDAPILACDEPTGNLDSATSAEIIQLIKDVAKDKLVLVVTHDYESIKDVCTRKIKLSDGEIIEDITFKEGVEEEKKELTLEDTKPTQKTLWRLASLNILSTPKKTVFSTLVFTFVACVFLLLSLFMIQVSYQENYTYNKSYGLVSEDRMIIYADNHEALDMEKLKPILKDYRYYKNAFYEEIVCSILIGGEQDYAYEHVRLTFSDFDYELIKGNATSKEDEFVLVMPEYYYYSDYATYIGKELSLTVTGDEIYRVPIGKIAGVGISDEVNEVYLIGGKFNSGLTNMWVNEGVSLYFTSSKTDETDVEKYYVKNEEKSHFIVPTELKGDIEFHFNLNNIYGISYPLDVVYSDEATNPVLVMNEDFLHGKIETDFGGVKEITVYAENVSKLEKQVTKLGYDVSIPSMVENKDGASLIVLYMLTIVILLALMIMFYISFAISQRIYLTKTKDYSIFRTLGLVSKDLKKILYIEVIIVTLLSIVLGAIFTNVIIILGKLTLYKYISGTVLILYAAVMCLFGLLTAHRLNNKIFKNSVYQALKEGGD